MLLSNPRSATAATTPSKPSGTTRITANGNSQLSYCAASTRYTIRTANPNTQIASPETCFSWNAIDVQSYPIDPGNSRPATSSIVASAWLELTPGAAVPVIDAVGYRLYRVIDGG